MNKNFYNFRSSSGLSVAMLRGSDPPKITGGTGGWEIQSRPRRVGITVWQGRDPYSLDIPILFDAYRSGASLEADIARLNQMAIGSDLHQPPTVKIDGALPIKGNVSWIISSIEWGTNVFWDQQGDQPYRTRQDAVVKVIQYNPVDRLVVQNAGHPNQYVTKRGETLRKVAQKMYGKSDRWQQIANAQTPRLRVAGTTVLKAGTKLRIPK